MRWYFQTLGNRDEMFIMFSLGIETRCLLRFHWDGGWDLPKVGRTRVFTASGPDRYAYFYIFVALGAIMSNSE